MYLPLTILVISQHQVLKIVYIALLLTKMKLATLLEN